MQVIYADVLFLINFAVNYLLLLATAKISAVYVSRVKIAVSALIGGIYSVTAVLFAQSLMQNICFKIGAALLMLLVSFGKERGLLRITLIFFAVSAAFGGIVLAVSLAGGGSAESLGSVSLSVLVPSFAASYALLTLLFKKLGKRRSGGFAKVVIEHKGRRTELNSLVDTGNSLTDPISGKTVIVAEKSAIIKLFDCETAKILNENSEMPLEVLEKLSELGEKFRLLPYSSVGLEKGMLLCFKPEKIIVNDSDKSGTLVAISPTRLSEGGIYSAIVGSEEMEVGA